MKTYTLTTLFVIALVLAACQSATPIPPTATLTPEPPTSTPTITPTYTPAFTPTVAAGGFPRRFHVEGNSFVDQYGQKMIFRGMAPIDPVIQHLEGPGFGSWNEHHYQVMAEWGANVIRIPIVPDSIRKHGMDVVLNDLDQTITWAAENKMYVIIDFHAIGWPPDDWYQAEGGVWTTQQQMKDFWDIISRRYADNDAVTFYELFCEPVNEAQSQWYKTGYRSTLADWMEWKAFMEEMITVVRTNDPDKIILVGGMQYSCDLTHVAEAPIADSNVAYVTHPYANCWDISWDTFGKLSSQYPVFSTEIGYDPDCNCPDPAINGIPYHQAIIDYFEAHQISWIAWVFDEEWCTSLLANIDTYQPSPWGEYVHSRLLELNQQP
jgi:endoglucanase